MAARTQSNNTSQTTHGLGTNKANVQVHAASAHFGHSLTVWADGTVWCNTDSVAIDPQKNFPRFMEIYNN